MEDDIIFTNFALLGEVAKDYSGQDIKKRRLSTLDSDSSELRNFLFLCQNEATVDAHGYVPHICNGYTP